MLILTNPKQSPSPPLWEVPMCECRAKYYGIKLHSANAMKRSSDSSDLMIQEPAGKPEGIWKVMLLNSCLCALYILKVTMAKGTFTTFWHLRRYCNLYRFLLCRQVNTVFNSPRACKYIMCLYSPLSTHIQVHMPKRKLFLRVPFANSKFREHTHIHMQRESKHW